MSEVSAAMRSIALNSFPVIPSCPERVQRVKRNPNLNSAESSLLTFFQESLRRYFAAKRNEHLKKSKTVPAKAAYKKRKPKLKSLNQNPQPKYKSPKRQKNKVGAKPTKKEQPPWKKHSNSSSPKATALKKP